MFINTPINGDIQIAKPKDLTKLPCKVLKSQILLAAGAQKPSNITSFHQNNNHQKHNKYIPNTEQKQHIQSS